jgi:hypothetical protein
VISVGVFSGVLPSGVVSSGVVVAGVVAARVVSAGVVLSSLVDLQDAKADTKSKRATVSAIIFLVIENSPSVLLFERSFITGKNVKTHTFQPRYATLYHLPRYKCVTNTRKKRIKKEKALKI